jgi:two-component system NarL family sensor kinase
VGAVLRFSAAGLVVVLLIAVGSGLVLRRSATAEAVRDARQLNQVFGEGIVEQHLPDSLLVGDRQALGRLDRVVRERVLTAGVIRVKLWSPAGRIIYSDAAQLIGDMEPLEDDKLEVLFGGGSVAEVSDLSKPDNRFERGHGRLLEVYLAVHTPGGQPLLFETYQTFRSVARNAQHVWYQMLPVALGGLLLLQLAQVPFAWSLARRLRQGQRQNEALLLRALDASAGERRRIARDLHDGVVQDLVGASYSLSAASRLLPEPNGSGEPQQVRQELDAAAECTRHSIRQLRTLLVDIYPPNLHTAGLRAALDDLLAPLASRGVCVRLDLPEDSGLPPHLEALIFRTVQEALRNVQAHARASSAQVRLVRTAGELVVEVRDDGRGFAPQNARLRPAEGHVGLRVLEDLAVEAGGRLELESAPGAGTTVRLLVPV